MADIFISYARKDRSKVLPISEALQAQGWSVFWDRVIPGGKTWDEVIEEELDAAKCVIVVWSKNGVTSKWVRAEAEEALNRNVLVPVSIEILKPPLLFRPIQTVQLTDWNEVSTHHQFKKLVCDLEAIIGTSPLEQKPDAEEKNRIEEDVKHRQVEEVSKRKFSEDIKQLGVERKVEDGVRESKTEEKKISKEEKPNNLAPIRHGQSGDVAITISIRVLLIVAAATIAIGLIAERDVWLLVSTFWAPALGVVALSVWLKLRKAKRGQSETGKK